MYRCFSVKVHKLMICWIFDTGSLSLYTTQIQVALPANIRKAHNGGEKFGCLVCLWGEVGDFSPSGWRVLAYLLAISSSSAGTIVIIKFYWLKEGKTCLDNWHQWLLFNLHVLSKFCDLRRKPKFDFTSYATQWLQIFTRPPYNSSMFQIIQK